MTLLFKRDFHERVRNGSIRVTYRNWTRPHVKVGGVYFVYGAGSLQVDSIDLVPLSEIGDDEARASGLSDRAELVRELSAASGALRGGARIHRITFHVISDARMDSPDTSAKMKADELSKLLATLSKMDRLSAHGPWIRATLELIARKPQTAASRLAPQMKRPLLPFKADVRKLKRRGLTLSHEVGYSLTPRGRAALLRMQASPEDASTRRKAKEATPRSSRQSHSK